MSLLGYALYLARGYYDLIRAIRNYSYEGYNDSSGFNNKEIVFTRSLGDRFNVSKNYLLRQKQDRYGFNRKTQISQRGLEIKLKNLEVKRQKVKRDERIRRDFLYDNTKSRRWAKRHHYISRKPQERIELPTY